MEFVSFHTHTTYSYADGFGGVKTHVYRVADLGMGALAVSEHGNVNSHAALERYCREASIKPIFGIEAYFGGVGPKRTQAKTHLTIFAMNEEGYHNLNKLVTQSYIDSHYWPTVAPHWLRKYNAGLVVLSGCSDSLISCSLLGGKFLGERREPSSNCPSEKDIAQARRKLEWFCDIFGPDRFFLEVQRFPQLARTRALNVALSGLSADTGVQLIATADVHYPFPHQNTMQKVLHAARRSGSVPLNEQKWEYDILLTYPQSDEEIISDLIETGLTPASARQAVKQTSLLADRCTVELPKAKPLRFKTSIGNSAKSELIEWIKAGWIKRIGERPGLNKFAKQYDARVKHELKVIVDKDFCDYFLAVADLVQFSKSADITVGPGRGSAAGSVICYLLGITEIDPLHPTFSRMVFERFIDPNRTDMPDIDLDFDDERRHEVPEQARKIYGAENVASVANHTGYRGKRALNDVARAYALPRAVFSPISKRIQDRNETDELVDDSIKDVVDSYSSDPGVSSVVEAYPDQIDQAISLEGMEHSMGIHAGGFVIASDPIPEVCAIYTKDKGQGRKREVAHVIPYEKRDAEHLGLLKMDFLGLKTMGVIGKIRHWTGMSLEELYSLFYKNCEPGNAIYDEIMESFRADNLTGIFQFEGNTTRQVTRDVQPQDFDELAACVSLSRPGPLYGGQTSEYVKVKFGESDWERIHEGGFDRHVEWTYGQIVYQEQIMWILRDLAGFDIPTVLRVRKIIGKKLGEHQFAALWEQFRNGCAANGVVEDIALRVWGAITTAAGYAFNTPHAYSYSLISWWTMYCKLYHNTEFFASSLAKNGDGKEEKPRRTALLQDAVQHQIEILDIHPDTCEANWSVVKPRVIRPGFAQIPNVGEATADDIVAWRAKQQRRIEWTDLLHVKGLGEDSIFKMFEFANHPDPFAIFRTEEQLNAFRKQCANGDFGEFGLPETHEFFTSSGLDDGDGNVAFVGLASNVVETDEVESYRQKTGKSVEDIKSKLDTNGPPGQYKKATIFAYDEYGELALRISRWRYEALSSRISAIKPDHHILVVSGRTFAGKANSIQVSSLWILEPD